MAAFPVAGEVLTESLAHFGLEVDEGGGGSATRARHTFLIQALECALPGLVDVPAPPAPREFVRSRFLDPLLKEHRRPRVRLRHPYESRERVRAEPLAPVLNVGPLGRLLRELCRPHGHLVVALAEAAPLFSAGELVVLVPFVLRTPVSIRDGGGIGGPVVGVAEEGVLPARPGVLLRDRVVRGSACALLEPVKVVVSDLSFEAAFRA